MSSRGSTSTRRGPPRQLNPSFRGSFGTTGARSNGGVEVRMGTKSSEAAFKSARYSGVLDLSNRGLTSFPSNALTFDSWSSCRKEKSGGRLSI